MTDTNQKTRDRTMLNALDTIANGRVGESSTPASDVVGLLMDVAKEALSSIEPTSSFELQASNAGAVDAWRDMASAPRDASEIVLRIPCQGWPDHYAQIGHWAEDMSGEEQPPFRGWFRKTGYGCAELNEPTGWMPLSSSNATLATPEPQTGERDGETYYTKGKDADWFEGLSDKDAAWALSCAAMDLNDTGMGDEIDKFMPHNAMLSGAGDRINRLLSSREDAGRHLAEMEERARLALAHMPHLMDEVKRVADPVTMNNLGYYLQQLEAALRAKPKATQETRHAEEAGAGASDDRTDGDAHVS